MKYVISYPIFAWLTTGVNNTAANRPHTVPVCIRHGIEATNWIMDWCGSEWAFYDMIPGDQTVSLRWTPGKVVMSFRSVKNGRTTDMNEDCSFPTRQSWSIWQVSPSIQPESKKAKQPPDTFPKNKSVLSQTTSSTAQGGGKNFKNRKPIGEVGCWCGVISVV